MIYPINFESKIGFDQVREMVKNHCLCSLGMMRADEMVMSGNQEAIEHKLNETEEFRRICLFEENFPTDNYIDVTGSIKKARTEGRFLEIEEVYNLKKSLEAVKAILRFFSGSEEKKKYPVLCKTAGGVSFYPFVLEQIDRILTKNGRIKDNASSELATIRKEIIRKQSNINRQLEHILKKARQEGYADEDSALTFRNGRLVIPVPAAYKRKVAGFIHDESATGKTAYIEPAEVVELNNELKELEYAESREIIKILVKFTDAIRPYLDELENAYFFLGDIDFMRAKALFAVDINAVKPGTTDGMAFTWIKAVHPLLFLTNRKMNKEVVPLDLRLDDTNRILLISGPNAGGKSVCLKTVGLLQYMLQCGMLVPMAENSSAGIFSDIFIDIGDEQSIENDLSTYSSHLLNMKYFVKHAGSRTLILIDEFGAGTEPILGGAIAEAILDRLNKSGTYGVMTTHYANLKHFASSVNGLINGAMLFDTGLIRPLFRLEIGKPGSSFAIDIARKIGLPEDILNSAADKAGQEHIQFDKHLREIIRDKRYWEEKRERIRVAEKRLQSLVDEYTGELGKAKKQQKEIISQARSQAEEILTGANRQIENTIRIIKESQADKEKTKEARTAVDKYREEVRSATGSGSSDVDTKLEKAKRLEKKLARDQKDSSDEKIGDIDTIGIGDTVRLVNQEMPGEVIDVNGDSIMVAFGSMVTTVKESRLLKISGREAKRLTGRSSVSSGFNVSERRLNFKPDIDIRGKRADEAIELIRKFVDEAIMVSVHELRILHGKGNGILKQITREYLNAMDVVKSCRDEHVERGGAGITIVELDV